MDAAAFARLKLLQDRYAPRSTTRRDETCGHLVSNNGDLPARQSPFDDVGSGGGELVAEEPMSRVLLAG